MRALPVMFVGLTLAGLGAAHAVPAAPAADTQAYLDSPAHHSAMQASFAEAGQRLVPGCDALTAQDAKTVVYKPISLSPKGEPDGGLFRESATVQGCGTSVRVNILAIARSDGPIKRVSLLPGTTIGDPMLQRAAMPYAFGGAQRGVPDGCQDVSIRNTDFLGYDPKNLEGKRPWREIWTISACKKPIAVEMIFQPDADGTTVIARPRGH